MCISQDPTRSWTRSWSECEPELQHGLRHLQRLLLHSLHHGAAPAFQLPIFSRISSNILRCYIRINPVLDQRVNRFSHRLQPTLEITFLVATHLPRFLNKMCSPFSKLAKQVIFIVRNLYLPYLAGKAGVNRQQHVGVGLSSGCCFSDPASCCWWLPGKGKGACHLLGRL